jgi:DNA-binding MarR family transcriptional regulator
MARKPSPASASPRAVSELESHLGFWLRYVSNHVSGAFQKAVEAQGVSVSEWVALRQLYGSGAASQGELMTALGMTRGAVSKIAKRLEDAKLLTRSDAPEDSRTWRLQLTPAGAALVPRLAALADANDAAFFGHLEPQVREGLVTLLKQVVELRGLTAVPTE